MAAQLPPCSSQKSEVDFFKILPTQRNAESEIGFEASGRLPTFYRPLRISLSEWAGIVCSTVISVGFVCALYLIDNPEHFRPGKHWPEVLYPRPSADSKQTVSRQIAQGRAHLRQAPGNSAEPKPRLSSGSAPWSNPGQNSDGKNGDPGFPSPPNTNFGRPQATNRTSAESGRSNDSGADRSTSAKSAASTNAVSKTRKHSSDRTKNVTRRSGRSATGLGHLQSKQNPRQASQVANNLRQNQAEALRSTGNVSRQSTGTVRGTATPAVSGSGALAGRALGRGAFRQPGAHAGRGSGGGRHH